MPTQQTGWVTTDQHFFSTQTEAENYEHLQRHFQNQFISTIDYGHNDGFAEYNNYTRAMVSVTPSLIVTLTSFNYPIDATQLPEHFTMTGDNIQKASYQATDINDATFMFKHLNEHLPRFINF